MSDTEIDAASEMKEEETPAQEETESPQTPEESEPAAVPSPKKSSPKKSPQKAAEDHEDEDEEESESDEEHLGILDKPVVIQEGKRERKKTDRMTFDKVEAPEKKVLEIPAGIGTKLGDCARIEHFLGRTKAADCKALHKLLYNRVGAASEVKKNIRKFCGFAFEKDSSEYEKKKALLSKMFTTPLKDVCGLLDLHRAGTKEEVIQRILDFLMKPEDSGRAPPKSKRKSKDGKKKRKRKSKGSSSADVSVDADDTGSDDNADGGEDGDNDDDAISSDEEEEKPKPKKRKVEKPKKAKKDAPKKERKTPKKSVPPKKRKVSVSDDSDDSDDEPLVKKKSPPTDDDLKDVVKKILDGADLEEVTMKTVLKKVYEKFPDFDLSDRKDFIKTTVKEIIS